MVELGGSQGVGVGGEVGGTINVEPGPIPHSPRAFKADIQLDSFLK